MTEPARISSLSELLPHVRDRFLMGQRDLRHVGVDVVVLETRRTPERQEWLYGSGRPDFPVFGRPGPILTNLRGANNRAKHVAEPGKGLAIDYLVRLVLRPQLEDWSLEQPWALAGSVFSALGFTWGGTWRKPWDLGHVEWPEEG